jgi:hypothetical protein
LITFGIVPMVIAAALIGVGEEALRGFSGDAE